MITIKKQEIVIELVTVFNLSDGLYSCDHDIVHFQNTVILFDGDVIAESMMELHRESESYLYIKE